MLTRKDLVHARQFLRRRLHTAIVALRPDPLDWSGNRLPGGTLIAVMLLVISVAAVGIYGFLRPAGAKSWTSCDRIILEKETGAPYVCDGRLLYPVTNFSSAALLRGLSPQPVRVSRSSLTWPRGPLVGVPEAPNSVPAAGQLFTGAWWFCVRPASQAGPVRSVVIVGARSDAGVDVTGEAIAVTNVDGGELHIVLHGLRHPVRDPDVVLQALGIARPDVVPVSPAWLATVPLGVPLGKIIIAGRGGPVTGRPSAKVGQILVAGEGTGKQRYVARPEGLQPVTALQEALIRATGSDTTPPMLLDQVQLAGEAKLPPLAEQIVGDGAVPSVVPMARSRGSICQVTAGVKDAPVIRVAVPVPYGTPVERTPVSPGGTLLADEVVVAPGLGALVAAVPSPDADTGPVFLVTETGRRHAIDSSEALGRLGLSGVTAVRLPSTLVERLVQGPRLHVLSLATPTP
ncbi:type VII secretion protein EccB [Dactylosporangium fulvum]|uniref:Type VII secretion protein EccB n=1 Tax=Dactylosporangium fulvum TaxID=53359 RepID=A0ABY5W291_9ACTN|nr:type VII secretion protein EccB [Dactylosporangium fulvum]UWP82181.1 type VII secretion protein EccB [Dactylosporangium fulvum]